MSRIRSTYEWAWEVTDEHGDIAECDYLSTLAECRQMGPAEADLALVRFYGNDEDGIVERTYAYCQPGPTGSGIVLPRFFEDGSEVPQRFHAEVSR